MTIQTSKNLILAKKASAMLIAMGFAFVLILFGMGATKLVIRALKEATHFEESEEAYFAAEGGLNQGLLIAKQTDAGFEADVPHIGATIPLGKTQINYLSSNGAYAKYTLRSRSKCIYDNETDYLRDNEAFKTPACAANEFYVPPPGWGTAGIECDTTQPWEYTDSNHPCNWSKLKIGETIEIPLYRQEADGSIKNPGTTQGNPGIGLSMFEAKMRLPCKEDPDGDGTCDTEYVLDINLNDVVIANWEITGGCDLASDGDIEPDDQCTMVMNVDDVDPLTYDSQITGSDIGGIVLYQGNYGDDITKKDAFEILPFLLNSGINFNDRNIIKPTLKLHFITGIQESDGTPIPYLEYQIKTDKQIGTPYKYVISEGFSGDFKQSLQIIQKLDTTVLDFVIQN